MKNISQTTLRLYSQNKLPVFLKSCVEKMPISVRSPLDSIVAHNHADDSVEHHFSLKPFITMKKLILLFCVFFLQQALSLNAQTYCISYKPVRDGNFVDVIVSMNSASNFTLGDANIQLLYKSAVLSNPTLKSNALPTGVGYSSFTVTSLSPVGLGAGDAVVSFNFVYTGSAGSGKAITTTSTEIGVIRFQITDEATSPNIRPYESNSTVDRTLIYNDATTRVRLLSTAGCNESYDFPLNTKISYTAAAYCRTSLPATVTKVGEAGGTFSASPAELTFDVSGNITACSNTAGGTYTINYATTSITPHYAFAIVTIYPATTATITDPTHLISPFVYCPSIAEFPLTAAVSPTGGTSAYTIDGFSRTTLKPSDLSPGSHTVSLTYTDLNGCSTTTTQAVTINSTPSITTQPTGVTVCAGSAINLSVGAAGTGVTYQWKKDGVNATGVSTNSTYANTLSAVGDAGLYTVVVSGTCTPSITSGNAVVVVNTAPAISTQPTASSTVCAGANVPLSVVATGTGLTYQWKKTTSTVTTDISGATSTDYTVTTTTADNSTPNSYSVVVSGVCPSPATSIVAAITVNIAPSITTHPAASSTVCASTSTTVPLSIVATGTGLTYQWKKAGVNISGATATSYTIPAAASAYDGSASGNYTVVVSGTCPSPATSNTAVVTINTAPSITIQPQGSTVCVGQTFNLGVVATGTALTYQWKKGGNIIVAANSNGYSAIASEVGSAGAYIVEISGTCAPMVTSTPPATIVVNIPPAITTQPQNATACVGAAINLSVATTGTALTYQWKKGSENIVGATLATYQIATSALADAGSYSVVVGGTCSPSIIVPSNAATVAVNALPAITQQPASSASPVCAGTNVTLSVGATGSNLTYQWLKNGVSVSSASATSSYTITNSQASDAGTYSVVIGGVCATNAPYGNIAVAVNLLPSALTGTPSVKVGGTTTLGNIAHGGTVVWGIQPITSTLSPIVSNSIASININNGLITGIAEGQTNITYTVTNACGTTPMTQLFTVIENTVQVSLKVFLEGPFKADRGRMSSQQVNTAFNPALSESASNSRYLPNDFKPFIPTTTPYAGVSETTTSTVINNSTGNNEIIDWVLVELRTTTGTSATATRSALLQSDGDIVDVDGVSPLTFSRVTAGSYYITIKHRNHLGFRTVGAIALTSTSTPLDFTGSETGIYKVDPSYSALKRLSNGVYAMFAGDANGDGAINVFDKNNVWLPVNGTNPPYHKADYNFDGAVGQPDENSYRLPNDSRVQQIEN